ncbi:MAG: peptide-methionine (S)-S-oxide reductase MsrA [Clostridia bacterium]
MRSFTILLIVFMLVAVLLAGCGTPGLIEESPAAKTAEQMATQTNVAKTEDSMRKIYFAGGCFWGTEQLMASIPGVQNAVSGYANGDSPQEANYSAVCSGQTNFRETVEVTYDPAQVCLEKLLLAYFYVIDPTVEHQQGNDIGSQYQTGIYYMDDASQATVSRIAAIEASAANPFCVEIGPLLNFYPAEEYHQDYLIKNPTGYCHIPKDEISIFRTLTIDSADYTRPAKALVPERLHGSARYQTISPAEVKERLDEQSNFILVDVRTPKEYEAGHIRGALLIPNETILSTAPVPTLPEPEAMIVVYCRSGKRSKAAADKLLKAGYRNVWDMGGIQSWPYEVTVK